MSDSVYTIKDLSRITGIPRRTIQFYIQQGVLPPAVGAGPAATYDEVHLFRLRLVPLLRNQGHRLDAIRERLNQVPPSDLPKLINEVVSSNPQSVAIPLHSSFRPHSYHHYDLPAGLQLIAPADLTPPDRARLNQLLRAALQIFNSES